MSRRVRASKRDIQPDPIYRSRLVTQIVNRMMVGGKKSTAEHIM
jgi:small subunit ribosomal protein S7